MSEMVGASSAEVFGEVLKHLREAAGLTQAELGRQIPCDRSLLARIETATRVPKEALVMRCDELLDTGGLLMRIWKQVDWYAEVERPDWFTRRVEMEKGAVSIQTYQSDVVTGLLQTPDYAQALFSTFPTTAEIDDRVRARMDRQRRFLSPNGPVFIAVLDESCIRNVVGSHRIMRAQCAHLLAVGQQANIRVQIAPAHIPNLMRPPTSMSIIRLPDGHEWIYTESLRRGHFYDDPEVVARHSQEYALLKADALSANESAALISEVMEGYGDEGSLGQKQLQRRRSRRLPGNSYLVQEQPQRQPARRLRGNRPRYPRLRPRPRQ
jgi:transcriptional regulator with XRE-family HTH domain